ncbi:hypothetical protein LCGC14_3111990 [marine sediment metagenome]|uniref:Uncharacterized protein n=1 Tax=marine sediment metagenome TaxID=412755 RepID=A0A0F8WTR4_9ZZZZ
MDEAELRQQFENERIAALKQDEKDIEVLKILSTNLNILREAKPKKQSELARRYAVAITEYEKSLAFFKFYVVDQG